MRCRACACTGRLSGCRSGFLSARGKIFILWKAFFPGQVQAEAGQGGRHPAGLPGPAGGRPRTSGKPRTLRHGAFCLHTLGHVEGNARRRSPGTDVRRHVRLGGGKGRRRRAAAGACAAERPAGAEFGRPGLEVLLCRRARHGSPTRSFRPAPCRKCPAPWGVPAAARPGRPKAWRAPSRERRQRRPQGC